MYDRRRRELDASWLSGLKLASGQTGLDRGLARLVGLVRVRRPGRAGVHTGLASREGIVSGLAIAHCRIEGMVHVSAR